MKKILLFIIMCVIFFSTSNVYAACYKVTYKNSNQLVGYVSDTLSYSDSSKYKVTLVNGDSSCWAYKSSSKQVSCGNMGSFSAKIPEITSWLITIVEIVVPVLLTILGAIDFIRAVVGQKEDDIKKAQAMFWKRFITAILVFFIVAFAKLVVNFFSNDDNESKSLIDCIDCFISNDCN